MIKEEAIEAIKEAYGNSEYTDEIIKALSANPCDDAISRQTVMEHYSTGEIANCHHISRNNLLDFIEQLPSVTPQQRTEQYENSDILDKIRSEIEFEVDHRTNMICAEDVFEIIDRYIAETKETEEDKDR